MIDAAQQDKRPPIIIIALVISLILHILIVVVLSFLQGDFVRQFAQDAPLEPQEKPLVFELVETPDAASETPVEPTDLASDKATRAQDEQPNELPISDTPYSEGNSANKDITPQTSQPQNQSSTQQQQPQSGEGQIADRAQPVVIPQMLRAEPNLENLRSEVAQKGGMLLNTYQWEYAPYLLKLKRRISENLVPPYAFTRLGIIGGQNLIRFRINPDGSIVAITLLWSDSHESLEQSSITAIRKAHPFIPLPSGFPREYLEVTALFTYNNKPQEGQK